MSSFVITTDTTSGQILETGEFGFVGPVGSILAPVGSAVTLAANATLISYGAMASATASGLRLNAVTNTSVTIAKTGSVVTAGIDLPAISGSFLGNFAFHNAGAISGGQGINLAAAIGSQINIANDGELQGLGITAGSAIFLVLNTTSCAVITNTGMLSTAGAGATVNAVGGGSVTLTNTGHLLNATPTQAAISVSGGLTLRNSGLIEGNVTATQSANIFNSGIIDGNLVLNNYNDVVRISGTVMGDVLLGNGTNVLWLTGGRVMGRVIGGAGADTYHVDRSDLTLLDTSGGRDKIYSSVDFQLSQGIEELYLVGGARALMGSGNGMGNVIVGNDGSDTLLGLGGDDSLTGGEGNNRLIGGFGNDTLISGTGDDYLAAGSGNDRILAGYGHDTIYGGLGEDVLSFDQLTGPLGVVVSLLTNKASFADTGGLIFNGIEHLQGSSYADSLTGTNGNNTLTGGGGADSLYGLAGNDTLIGGAQGDLMDGGSGLDVFVFVALSDSAVASGLDTINGFQASGDVINIAAIDAVTGGSDDAFSFIGTQNFSGAGPEVRYERDAVSGTTTIEIRLSGSVVDDMDIVLNGLFNLAAGNFVL